MSDHVPALAELAGLRPAHGISYLYQRYISISGISQKDIKLFRATRKNGFEIQQTNKEVVKGIGR